MRIVGVIVIIIGVFFIVSLNSFRGNRVVGTYVSKTPGIAETISIMYTKGYIEFFYTTAGNSCLELKPDNSFTYSGTYCKVGVKVYAG